MVDDSREFDVLGLSPGSQYAPAAPDATKHKSLKGAWNFAEFIPKRHWNADRERWERRMNLYRRRTMPAGSLVHESAYLQGADYQKRFPQNAVMVPILRAS